MIWKLSMVWAAAMLFAIVLLQRHVAQPAPSQAIEQAIEVELTAQQRSALRLDERPCLLLFQNPFCPCARTTRQNLADVLVDFPIADIQVKVIDVGRVADKAVASSDAGFAALPGVECFSDESGQLAMTLGVQTSGHVLLFDSQGQPLFSGGITAGRGHAGRAAGLVKLEQQLRQKHAVMQHCEFFPVWGCPLFDRRGTQ